MYVAPWARLTTSSSPKTSAKPSANSARPAPCQMPFTSCCGSCSMSLRLAGFAGAWDGALRPGALLEEGKLAVLDDLHDGRVNGVAAGVEGERAQHRGYVLELRQGVADRP